MPVAVIPSVLYIKIKTNMKFKITLAFAVFALMVASCGSSSDEAKSGKEQAKEMSDALMDEMEAATDEVEETDEDIEDETKKVEGEAQ